MAKQYLLGNGYKKTPATDAAGAISSPSHVEQVSSGIVRYSGDYVKSYSDRTPTPSLRQTLTAMEVTPDMNETERYLPPASDANAVFVDRPFVRQDSRRRDYQYTVDGARDFSVTQKCITILPEQRAMR